MQLLALTDVSTLPPPPAPHNRDVNGTAQLTLALDVKLGNVTDPLIWPRARLVLEGTEGTL